jgi:hypothetical protein
MAGPTQLRRMRNATLHLQGKREVEMARRAGFSLAVEPEGVDLPLGNDSAGRRSIERFALLLTSCADAGHVVLVGGSSRLWISAAVLVERNKWHLPELYSFVTARLRDRRGRFVFQPVELAPHPFCEISSSRHA